MPTPMFGPFATLLAPPMIPWRLTVAVLPPLTPDEIARNAAQQTVVCR